MISCFCRASIAVIFVKSCKVAQVNNHVNLSLYYCSRFYCIPVPILTALHFPFSLHFCFPITAVVLFIGALAKTTDKSGQAVTSGGDPRREPRRAAPPIT
jgi:hypothetical protein